MTPETRKRKIEGFMRTVLAANLIALIDHHYREIPAVTNRYKKLSEKTGLSVSSIQRFCKAEQGASIDTIELFADAFDLSAYHLLLPNLEVDNPQIVKGATAGERLMYKKFQRAQRNRKEL